VPRFANHTVFNTKKCYSNTEKAPKNYYTDIRHHLHSTTEHSKHSGEQCNKSGGK